MQLITYADRLGGNLSGLHALLDNELRDLFCAVHILPFFDPIDGADAGFDPSDHTRVDPSLGDWQDIAEIAADYRVMADLIVNHISADSEQFQEVRRDGAASRFWDLFLKRSDVFADDDSQSQSAVDKIFRPRPGAPFTSVTLNDGRTEQFWTTFSSNQIDINVEIASGRAYLDSILEQFAASGIREIRLDAAGYAIKRRGSSCFMLPETYDFIATLSTQANQLGMETLVEIHSHFRTQIEIAERVGRVYDFALPPLVLHTLYTKNATALRHWLGMAPRNCITVLDTHDGIGIHDVARQDDCEGLLRDEEIDSLVETIHERTGGSSLRASGQAASNLDIYQVNTTYYDALGRNDVEYLIARAIQFFCPGVPQVYYVGLFAGGNDSKLVERTNTGRDINRHYYTQDEVEREIQRPVVKSLFDLIRLRNEVTAFDGSFSLGAHSDAELSLRWDNQQDYAVLNVDLTAMVATIDVCTNGCVRKHTIDQQLLCEGVIERPRIGGES